MKKSFLFLSTSYQGITYIKYVKLQKQWQIKTLFPQNAINSSQGGVLERRKTSNFPLFWKATSRRSRNVLIKTLPLPVRFWPLLKHWQNKRQIKALVLLNTAEGQPLPSLKPLRSIIIMNHFLLSVKWTGGLLHAQGGV